VGEPNDDYSSYDCLVVDSLAFRFGRPQTSIPYVALMHQLPSAVLGYPEPTVQERDVLRFADLVVTVSEWLREQVARYSSGRIVVVPPGRDRAWAREGPDDGADTVLSVADARPGKGVPEAVEAFALASPHHTRLVLAGDLEVDTEESERVRKALDRCDAQVEVAGVTTPSELAGRYARARVFLTGTLYEGRPIAVGEAMASGVPVVGFDVPGLREMVRPGRDGLLAPAGDVEDMAGCLHDLLEQRDLAAALGRSARHRALQWPTWAETAERFADALQETVAT
jgi:glycosyltransferase involved in cell wall biosynthesis